MRLIIDEDVYEVLWLRLPDDSQRPHMHERRAVAVHDINPRVRALERNAERDRARVPHGSNGEEIMAMPLAAPFA